MRGGVTAVKAGSRPPWLGLGAAVWVQVAGGAGSTFALFSHALKLALGVDQRRLALLAVAYNVRENLGLLPEVLCNRLHPALLLLIDAAACILGYGATWLAVFGIAPARCKRRRPARIKTNPLLPLLAVLPFPTRASRRAHRATHAPPLMSRSKKIHDLITNKEAREARQAGEEEEEEAGEIREEEVVLRVGLLAQPHELGPVEAGAGGGVVDGRKLTLEACAHATQNERLPLRMVVQVLFFEQLQLRRAIAQTIMANEGWSTGQGEEDGDSDNGGTWKPATWGNQMLRLDMDSMQNRVQELERECTSMRKAIEKMDRRGGAPGAASAGEGRWGSMVTKQFRCKFPTQVCQS